MAKSNVSLVHTGLSRADASPGGRHVGSGCGLERSCGSVECRVASLDALAGVIGELRSSYYGCFVGSRGDLQARFTAAVFKAGVHCFADEGGARGFDGVSGSSVVGANVTMPDSPVSVVPGVREDIAVGSSDAGRSSPSWSDMVEEELELNEEFWSTGPSGPVAESSAASSVAAATGAVVAATGVAVEAPAVVPPTRFAVRRKDAYIVGIRTSRGDVGGFCTAANGVGDRLALEAFRRWVYGVVGANLPARCEPAVLAISLPRNLGDVGRIAYKSLSLIGDRAIGAALAYKCVLLDRPVSYYQPMKAVVASNAALGRAFVNQGLAHIVPSGPGMDWSVGRSGGSAYEVVAGVVVLHLGIRSLERVMAPLFVDAYADMAAEGMREAWDDVVNDLGDAHEDFSPIADAVEFGKRVHSYELALRALVHSVTGNRYPKKAPELQCALRYGTAMRSKDKERIRMMCQLGREVMQLALAARCYEMGVGPAGYNRASACIQVEELALRCEASGIMRLFAWTESREWKSNVVRCNAVYLLVGCIAKRMSLQAVSQMCNYFKLLDFDFSKSS